ncbi:hypothetical protein MHB44_10380 [Lysinibacillus sp. FSL H8-0500]|uniref:Uncharacterized protein n=1 Tax=Lysinibacillus macroides TaxID=33935 RepID=A0A0N0CUW8_9BACI|nr:hypothetical protein [Lysinibacillus macroides]KOY80514.1 hypothetical protein ADM90_14960 [Lysinibacillus macroides]QPR69649.1 hypothetical protein I6G82_08740 [Lysinibacillus macroides]
MKLNKLFSTIMIFCLIYSTLMFNPSTAKAQENTNTQNVKFTPFNVSDTYSKVKVENLETGEVEYLESILEDGKYVHYVFSDSGELKHKIEAIGNKIYVDGEVFAEISEITEELQGDPALIKNNEFTTQAIKWEYISTSSGNSSWKYAQASLIAGVIATLLGVPAGWAIPMSIASTFASLELTTVYYKKSHYVDANRTFNTCKRASNTSFYKYSNYTGLIEITGLVQEYIDPCNSGY